MKGFHKVTVLEGIPNAEVAFLDLDRKGVCTGDPDHANQAHLHRDIS